MKLYDVAGSGNCYKPRLMLSFLGLEAELVPIDFAGGEHKTPDFIKLNPRGQIPVLVDDSLVVYDSQAILVYLAAKYGNSMWLPNDPEGLAEVMAWLSFAANEIYSGPMQARAIKRLGRAGDLAVAQTKSEAALDILEGHLAQHDWLACGRTTIADIACYPYVGMVGQGGIDLSGRTAVRAWIARFEALPRYTGMPGLPAKSD